MKVCIFQPAYSTDYSKSDFYFNEQMKLIDLCDDSMDLIVLPEAADIPCLAGSKENGELSSAKETEMFLDMGIDVILTNDYNRIAGVVEKREKYINY